MGVQRKNNDIMSWVCNSSILLEKVKYQVFKHSFSTKGRGRGLGTYSMKLLGETCLGGKVDFTSTEAEGTIFFIRLPKNGQD